MEKEGVEAKIYKKMKTRPELLETEENDSRELFKEKAVNYAK